MHSRLALRKVESWARNVRDITGPLTVADERADGHGRRARDKALRWVHTGAHAGEGHGQEGFPETSCIYITRFAIAAAATRSSALFAHIRALLRPEYQ